MAGYKEQVQKSRLKLTATTLKVWNEKYMKGDVQTPLDVLEEIMINAPKDSDKINAAKEIIRLLYQRPPSESEVQISDDSSVHKMTKDEFNEHYSSKLTDFLTKHPQLFSNEQEQE